MQGEDGAVVEGHSQQGGAGKLFYRQPLKAKDARQVGTGFS